MKINIYVIFVFLIPYGVFSQISQITLEGCQEKAIENYPLIQQYNLLTLSEQYNLENLAKNYLPQVTLNGQASYQTDVTSMPIKVPGINIPSMDKDQYKVTLDVSQLIWDGGATHSQSEITKAKTMVDKKQVETSLYSIKDKVNQLYFGILTIDEQLKQLEILRADYQVNYNLISSMLKNGEAMASDLDLIEVEILNTDQTKIELITAKEAYIKMLSLFIHEVINNDVVLEIPEDYINANTDITRPELALYDSQRALYKEQESSIKAKNMPKFSFFVQGGYGKPGLNMLEPEFKTFAIGGIKLSWNFGNLYTRENEKRIIDTNKQEVDVQQETFLFNTNLQLTQIQQEIDKYAQLMDKDEEIIALRKRVKIAAESKYKNGIYQINDLVSDINAENQARLTQSMHKIQYLQSIYNYKYTNGN